MKAKEFYDSFVQQIYSESSARGRACVEKIYTNSTRYTQYIKKIVRKILSNPTASGKVEVNCEYYRVDFFAWEKMDDNVLSRQPPKSFKKQFWKPVAAVEHENDCDSWMDEVIKLSYLKVPLKVVICYVPAAQRPSDHEYLDYVSEVLSALGYEQVEDEEFLLIIGSSRTKDPRKYFGYEPYIYNSETRQFESPTGWN